MRFRKSDNRLPTQALSLFGLGVGVALLAWRRRARARLAADPPALIRVTKSISIDRPPGELYAFIRKLDKLPVVLRHVESVHQVERDRAHWVASGAGDGVHLEWDADVTTDLPGELVAWQSVAGAEVPNQGFIDLKPLARGQGTLVTVHVQYGKGRRRSSAALAELFHGDPDAELEEDLRRWKRLMESPSLPKTIAARTSRRAD